jgi:hypothetical protein
MAELGLSREQIEAVLNQLDSLLRGAISAGEPMQEGTMVDPTTT